MFHDIETALIGRIVGVIPGAPVLGTFDLVDFAEEGAPRIAVQVRWLGFSVEDQATSAAKLMQRFEVAVLVDAARARDVERSAAAEGLTAIVQQLLGFEITRGQRLTLAGQTPPPDFDGFTLRLSVFFSVPGVITASR